eukprot:Protomagalhaensia_wolfi_Nauph_80__2601@NODE_2749_length_999_cov_12_582292_g2154_i0_p1_GENE_NODE_2749_length_999_cov_12_582292_g2154_i0NODE_2749_length_999_cov_12_582292_g2154_i0_p1_ORF_typecomplete_len289_score76_49_NODE_2749_length_999_cov_12_582292_g2154_i064930
MGSCKSTPRKPAQTAKTANTAEQATAAETNQAAPVAAAQPVLPKEPVAAAQPVLPKEPVTPRNFENPIGPNPPPVPACAAPAQPELTTVVEVASSGSSTPRVIQTQRKASSSAVTEETSKAVEEKLVEPETAKEPEVVESASSSSEEEEKVSEEERLIEEPVAAVTRLSLAASEMTSLSSAESLAGPVRQIRLAETSSEEEEVVQKRPSRSLSSSRQTPIQQRRISIASEDIPDGFEVLEEEESEEHSVFGATAVTADKAETQQIEIQETEAFEARCCERGLLSMCKA